MAFFPAEGAAGSLIPPGLPPLPPLPPVPITPQQAGTLGGLSTPGLQNTIVPGDPSFGGNGASGFRDFLLAANPQAMLLQQLTGKDLSTAQLLGLGLANSGFSFQSGDTSFQLGNPGGGGGGVGDLITAQLLGGLIKGGGLSGGPGTGQPQTVRGNNGTITTEPAPQIPQPAPTQIRRSNPFRIGPPAPGFGPPVPTNVMLDPPAPRFGPPAPTNVMPGPPAPGVGPLRPRFVPSAARLGPMGFGLENFDDPNDLFFARSMGFQ